MSEHVHVSTAERVTTLQLARPEKKNALTLPMYRALTAAIAAAAADADVRAVIITGTADCFTSGNDLGDFVAAAQGGDVGAPIDFLRALATLDKPLVAAVAGVAIGIGTTLLLHCDLVYAAPTARFKTPFVDLALVPEGASSLLLPALIGARRAAQMLLLGEQVDAPTALAWGLVNAVVADPAAAARTAALHLASRAPGAIRGSKELLARPQRAAILETLSVEGEAFLARLKSPEAMIAFQAIMAKRPAVFTDRPLFLGQARAIYPSAAARALPELGPVRDRAGLYSGGVEPYIPRACRPLTYVPRTSGCCSRSPAKRSWAMVATASARRCSICWPKRSSRPCAAVSSSRWCAAAATFSAACPNPPRAWTGRRPTTSACWPR